MTTRKIEGVMKTQKINDFQGRTKHMKITKIRGKEKVKVLIIMTYHEKF